MQKVDERALERALREERRLDDEEEGRSYKNLFVSHHLERNFIT